MVDLSIVVPLYNEEESVTPLYQSICATLESVEYDTEIIFVDDGSRDATFSVAQRLAATDPRLRVIKFRRNYGQTPAMAAGIDIAQGQIIITMDGDLQNDPADIPGFLSKMAEGYDIVVGWRFDRQDKLISRKIPSRIANWLIGKVTGVPIKDNGCSLKAYRADVIKDVPLYSEMHRFIPAMTSIAGTRIAEIGRAFGVSRTRATQLVAREELRRKGSFDPQVTPRLPDSRIRSPDTPEYRPCLIGLLPPWSLQLPSPAWLVPQPAGLEHGPSLWLFFAPQIGYVFTIPSGFSERASGGLPPSRSSSSVMGYPSSWNCHGVWGHERRA